jgi:hypothetical protein
MPRKRIDYAGMISVYDNINRTRPLTEREADRLQEILRKQADAEKAARYRAANPQKALDSMAAYRGTKGYQRAMGKAAVSDSAKRKHARYRAANREALAGKERAARERRRETGEPVG